MSDKWVKVFSTSDLYQAELIKGMLAEEEIDSVVMNKQDSAYITIGEVELYVSRENVIRANHLIQKQQE